MSDSSREKNIRALVGMMNEPDPEFYGKFREALLAVGDEAIPFVDEALRNATDEQTCQRLQDLLNTLRVEGVCRELTAWKAEEEPDLLRGFYWVSKAFYPNLEWEEVRDDFNNLFGDGWQLLDSSTYLRNTLARYNNFFFNICGFSLGKRLTETYSFADFFLPNLLHRRQGNERALALVYHYLAQRNRIPVFLFNLPIVNLLACTTDISLPNKDDVRFCIDITQRGAMVHRMDLEPVFSQKTQIQLCNTIQALQDYVKLLFLMVNLNEKETFKKETARKLHLCLGSSPLSAAFSPQPGDNLGEGDWS